MCCVQILVKCGWRNGQNHAYSVRSKVNPIFSWSLALSRIITMLSGISGQMAALRSRCGHYIFVLWFLLLSSFSPRLISAAADWMSTILSHMVWPWCIYNAGLKCAACGSLKIQVEKIIKNSPSGHHHTTLSDCIFAIKAHIDDRKKLVKQQCLLHMSSQYGELRPINGWDRFGSLGHPSKFQRLSSLGSIVGVSQTLQHWEEGATYIWQGGHHVGHWPTF